MTQKDMLIQQQVSHFFIYVLLANVQMTHAPSGQGLNAKTNAVTLNSRSKVA
jgi:hypothetical protein